MGGWVLFGIVLTALAVWGFASGWRRGMRARREQAARRGEDI